ncbi:protein kinase [Streptomyces sp. NPDC093510]|uniref:serine/threonine-protein kinase n=1 Tax=Streptomyces sp. NPDC093510 TaxID=3155199 RepID=UPI00343C4E2D
MNAAGGTNGDSEFDGFDGFDLAGSGAEPLRAQDPRRIGTIPLVGRLGAGGMGRVYLGVVDGRYAAVKQMLASVVAEDRGFLRRFGQEMDNLGRLPAEATAPLLASDRTAEPPWFATAYVPGITLSEAVERLAEAGSNVAPSPTPPRPTVALPSDALPGDALSSDTLSSDALWLLLREVAAGLKAVHGLDMVHRDLKPSNVMLTLDGVTLIDFGIARAAEQSQLTQTGLVVGTPAYMSPEQASGKRGLTSASDIFALGLLVGYAASGRWPFTDAGEGSPLYRIVHDEPDLAPLRELDPELAELVATCLDKDPEGRPTAPELVEAAARHTPSASGTPVWPAPVLDVLTERAAFAARIPAAAPEPPPEPTATPTPTPTPTHSPTPAPLPISETTPDARPPRRERRRTRIVMAAVPVVVVAAGTTLALQNLPYVTGPDRASGSTPSAPVTAPADPTQPSGAPSKSSPKKPKDEKDAKGKDKSREGTEDGPVGSGNKDGGAGKGDRNGGDASNAGSGSTESSSGTGTGADSNNNSDSDSDSAGTGSEDSPPAPSSGPFRLKNADNDACLTQVYGSADDGSCGDPSASWKTVRAENNSFKVVNKQSGSCLVANMLGQAVFVGDCTQGGARLWRWGSGGTLKSTSNGGCLDLAYGGGVSASTCQSGKASQHWAR